LVRCRKDGKWSGLSYRRLRDRSRSQELDFDQIKILARQTGCAKVTLPKPGQLGASAAKQDNQPARSEAIRRLVEVGFKVKGNVMQNLLLGVGIGLVGTLVVLTARYVAAVLTG
jgi:hypothetical protein